MKRFTTREIATRNTKSYYWGRRSFPKTTTAARTDKNVTPSAAPTKPNGPAGNPEPVLTLVLRDQANNARTAR